MCPFCRSFLQVAPVGSKHFFECHGCGLELSISQFPTRAKEMIRKFEGPETLVETVDRILGQVQR